MQGTRSAAVRQCPLAFCYLWTSAIGFWNYSVHWLWQGNGSCKYTLVHSARSFTTKVTCINNSDLQSSFDMTTCFPTPAPLTTSSPPGFSTKPACTARTGWQFSPLFLSGTWDHAEYDPLCLVFNQLQWGSGVSILLAVPLEDLACSDVLTMNTTILSSVLRFVVMTGSVFWWKTLPCNQHLFSKALSSNQKMLSGASRWGQVKRKGRAQKDVFFTGSTLPPSTRRDEGMM